jgi:hypothetical protein
LTIRTIVKMMVLFSVYGTVLVFALLVHVSHRYSNVSKITVLRLADLDEAFEVGTSRLRVRNPEFLKVCFAGDYVYALKDAKQWFAGNEAEFMPALEAAGGPADTYNGEGNSSIVLLSHTFALILQLDWRSKFFATNLGCASTDAGDIEIKRYQTNSSTEFYLPNATLKSPRGSDQSQATLCAEKLGRFVESIDELLAESMTQHERFWAVIRKYLPAKGCSFNEAISIFGTSKFLVRSSDLNASRTIIFENSETIVSFGLEKDTGNIDYPAVFSAGLPSF